MCEPVTATLAAVGVVTSLAGGVMAADAATKQGHDDARTARLNAFFARRQAADATARGAYETGLHRMRGTQAASAQAAAAGASGVVGTSGTAAAVQSDARAWAELDALTTANNAAREAWGYQVQSSQLEESAVLARKRASAAARAHLLNGGLQAVNAGASAFGKFSPSSGGSTGTGTGLEAGGGRLGRGLLFGEK